MSFRTPETTDDRPSNRFTWKIENFSKLTTKKLYSNIFNIGGYKWRLLVFPKGNAVNYLSVYLDVPDSPKLPYGCGRYAEYGIAIINQLDNGNSVRKCTRHLFSRQADDWGFTSFMMLSELCNPARGYLVNDAITVEIDFVLSSHESEKEIGHVGLENQGAELGDREESQHPSQNNSEVSSREPVQQDFASMEPPSVGKETERVPSEPTLCACCGVKARTLQPSLGTQNPSVSASHQGSTEAILVDDSCTVTQAVGHASSGKVSDSVGGRNVACLEDAAPAGKIRFLSYWVSSKASTLLQRIHDLHKGTFTKFSMKGRILQTVLLESFASFMESMSTTKVHEVNEEALCLANNSIEDFEQVGLDLSWLKQRLGDAKRVNKHSESLLYVDLCERALKHARAKVRELEEGLAKAKQEAEVESRELPKSLSVDDSVLKDVV